jgi:hypothetical protein
MTKSRSLRLTVILDRELRKDLRFAAERRGTSLAIAAAELLREALKRDDDLMLSRLAARREETAAHWHTHDEAWSLLSSCGGVGVKRRRRGRSHDS